MTNSTKYGNLEWKRKVNNIWSGPGIMAYAYNPSQEARPEGLRYQDGLYKKRVSESLSQ
jgi:hypothetical protein